MLPGPGWGERWCVCPLLQPDLQLVGDMKGRRECRASGQLRRQGWRVLGVGIRWLGRAGAHTAGARRPEYPLCLGRNPFWPMPTWSC
eukprot:1159864-Pelagomonas_calceolata.AAC.5